MSIPWQIRVYENHHLVFSEVLTGRAELGRQNKGEAGPYRKSLDSSTCRLVIARLEEDSVSRKHVLVEPLDGGRLRLCNESKRQAVRFADGTRLEPTACREMTLPVVFTIGSRTIRLQQADQQSDEFQSLSEATVAPGSENIASRRLAAASLSLGDGAQPMEAEAMVRWIQAALGVLHSAASSMEFFEKAARTVVELAGLDSGRILLLENGDWKVQAQYAGGRGLEDPDWQPSRQVLARVLSEKKTFWQVPPPALSEGSLLGIKAVVAAPILNRRGEIIGALYGDRRQTASMRPITRLEAMLVEVLASGVAAGLARVEQEQAALRAQVQFEQFFTPKLARYIQTHPDLLQGRDAGVTVLFCDIRGFSRFSERLGPARTVEWIRDTLGVLSACVLEQEGVLVDYIGDELMAMWGAPDEQPDHGARACHAALAMLDRLPSLNERWQPVLGEPIDLGIGVNSGVARVGDIGTPQKFKYGALGNTVNLASRVQGATKYLKSRLLVTHSTRQQLDAGFAVRRLCQVRVVNIAEPVALYELVAPGRTEWTSLQQGYEEALQKFEQKEFRLAARVLGRLLPDHPNDGPSLVLMSRAVNCLVEEPEDFDPVWQLPGK